MRHRPETDRQAFDAVVRARRRDLQLAAAAPARALPRAPPSRLVSHTGGALGRDQVALSHVLQLLPIDADLTAHECRVASLDFSAHHEQIAIDARRGPQNDVAVDGEHTSAHSSADQYRTVEDRHVAVDHAIFVDLHAARGPQCGALIEEPCRLARHVAWKTRVVDLVVASLSTGGGSGAQCDDEREGETAHAFSRKAGPMLPEAATVPVCRLLGKGRRHTT